MKVTIRHPAFVRAKTKGGRVARPSVVLPEAEFNISDLDSRQAPVAFTVRKTIYGRPVVREVRAFSGGLYLRVKKENSYSQSQGPETLDELVAAVSTGPLNRKGFLLPIIEKVRSGMRGADGETILPSGIYNGLSYHDLPDDHALVADAIKLTDQIVIDDEVRAEISAWHAVAQGYIDEYIAVDGSIYERCGEPVYELHQSIYSANLEVHYLEAGQANGPTTQITFAATSRAEALEALEVAKSRIDPEKEQGYNGDTGVHIEVADESYVNWRAEERDFDRFARAFERTFNSGIDDLRERKNIFIPRAVYDAWLDLRDLLSTYEKMSGTIPEELEGVLSIAIDTWRGFQKQIGDNICSKKAPSVGTVDTLFQRFADRPIDMGSVVGYGGPQLKP